MDTTELFEGLLSIGRSGRFEDVQSLPGAGIHAKVLRLADAHFQTIIGYVAKLNNSDRRCFIMAVAAYENTVGGLGSVTSLFRLLPLVDDPDHVVIDWILSNTQSYWYYSFGATSFDELEVYRQAHASRRAESLHREQERELLAKRRRAERATSNLYNAVRRGDIQAVTALLMNGADPNTRAPDGTTLYEFALAHNHVEIANILAIGEHQRGSR